MEAFLVSVATVALAEVGDKTQLLAFFLAARLRKPVAILLGIFIATLANHSLAGLLGVWITTVLYPETLRWIIGLIFLAVAVWALVPDRLAEEKTHIGRYGAFVTSVVAFFLVEMGDKTQIATAALAAHFGNLLAVVGGTTLGMMIADGPAVFLGEMASHRLPLKYVRYAAALLFGVIGILILAGVGSI